MTTGKTIALTILIFVGKAMYLLFNMFSRFVLDFLARSKRLLISWLQSLSEVILMDSVGEGEGGKIWENGIETCKISCMNMRVGL